MRNRILISAIVASLFFALITIANAQASVYVKVDANGIAIDGPIMCDAGTCGAGSEFSRLTLKEGERYVLQGTGSAGIGGNNPNIEVKVDSSHNWTVTNTQTNTVVQEFTPQTNPSNNATVISNPTPEPKLTLPRVETITATVETITATVDTSTVSVLRSISAMPQVIKITRDKNGKLIVTKKPITVKVRKAVKR